VKFVSCPWSNKCHCILVPSQTIAPLLSWCEKLKNVPHVLFPRFLMLSTLKFYHYTLGQANGHIIMDEKQLQCWHGTTFWFKFSRLNLENYSLYFEYWHVFSMNIFKLVEVTIIGMLWGMFGWMLFHINIFEKQIVGYLGSLFKPCGIWHIWLIVLHLEKFPCNVLLNE
jgi:hypothetical protein